MPCTRVKVLTFSGLASCQVYHNLILQIVNTGLTVFVYANCNYNHNRISLLTLWVAWAAWAAWEEEEECSNVWLAPFHKKRKWCLERMSIARTTTSCFGNTTVTSCDIFRFQHVEVKRSSLRNNPPIPCFARGLSLAFYPSNPDMEIVLPSIITPQDRCRRSSVEHPALPVEEDRSHKVWVSSSINPYILDLYL